MTHFALIFPQKIRGHFMKRTKQFEKTLYYFICNADRTTNSIVNEMLKFWEHYDALFQTNHYQILKALASPVNACYTAEGLALHLNVSDRTLLRYRNLYVESYVAMCEKKGVDPYAPAE